MKITKKKCSFSLNVSSVKMGVFNRVEGVGFWGISKKGKTLRQDLKDPLLKRVGYFIPSTPCKHTVLNSQLLNWIFVSAILEVPQKRSIERQNRLLVKVGR